MKIRKIIRAVLSVPNTIYVNLKYLPFRTAIMLPLLVSYDTLIYGKGRISIQKRLRPLSIKIGFFDVETVEKARTKITLHKDGILIMGGETQIGRGCKIFISPKAVLSINDNSTISASTNLRVYKRITIGKDCRISWECQIMDNNMHMIEYEDGSKPNAIKEVFIGNKVWIASRAMIMMGTVIPDNCIIGCGAIVKGHRFEENSIIAGNPAKVVKKIKGWDF